MNRKEKKREKRLGKRNIERKMKGWIEIDEVGGCGMEKNGGERRKDRKIRNVRLKKELEWSVEKKIGEILIVFEKCRNEMVNIVIDIELGDVEEGERKDEMWSLIKWDVEEEINLKDEMRGGKKGWDGKENRNEKKKK